MIRDWAQAMESGPKGGSAPSFQRLTHSGEACYRNDEDALCTTNWSIF
jgi:hypothetical protein